jgi:chitin deacetylase
MPDRYPRDLLGYGETPPDAQWPEGARVAVSLVLNYEEGGENSILHGDAASEAFLSDIAGAQPWPGMRHWNMESIYDYGARAGFWRLHRMLRDLPVTVYGVATALARSPEPVAAMKAASWEIASHGLKWVEHRDMLEEEERAQVAEAIRLHAEVVGEPPRGWYTGRCSANTVRLTAGTGRFDWISDAYDDDLPHWIDAGEHWQLVIPYTLECNDMRFAVSPGWVTGRDFGDYLCDTFDVLHKEGGRMMSVGLHCRLVGRPGKAAGLRQFLRHAQQKGGAWFATRGQIAAHWARPSSKPSAASWSTPPGSPTAPGRWSSAPRTTAPPALPTRWRACCGPPPRRNSLASYARTPTSPESWQLRAVSRPSPPPSRPAPALTP